MNQNLPLVSIGFAVYNAAELLPQALNALLAQTYVNFELILSDNASTDSTWEICNFYARQDERIRLYRNESNIGAARNFQKVVDLARGDFFMWAAHDDLWHSEFIASCLAAFQQQPDSALCYVQHEFHYHYNNSRVVQNFQMDLQQEDAWQRALNLLECWPIPNVIIYGLMRTNDVRQVLPLKAHYGSDSIFLLKLVIAKPFIAVAKPLHTYGITSKRGVRTRLKQLGNKKGGIWQLWYWDIQLLRNLIQETQTIPQLTFAQRLQLLAAVWKLIYRATGWPFSIQLLKRYGSILLPEILYRRALK